MRGRASTLAVEVHPGGGAGQLGRGLNCRGVPGGMAVPSIMRAIVARGSRRGAGELLVVMQHLWDVAGDATVYVIPRCELLAAKSFRGCWGRSMSCGGLSKPLTTDGVAVFPVLYGCARTRRRKHKEARHGRVAR